MPATDRKLRVFLCHVCPSGYALQDKPIVPQRDDICELYQRLNAALQGDDKGWIDPWLNE